MSCNNYIDVGGLDFREQLVLKQQVLGPEDGVFTLKLVDQKNGTLYSYMEPQDIK